MSMKFLMAIGWYETLNEWSVICFIISIVVFNSYVGCRRSMVVLPGKFGCRSSSIVVFKGLLIVEFAF